MARSAIERYLLCFTLFMVKLDFVKTKEYCEDNYVCEDGHCCGHGQCCTYYYELWWFWLIWFVVAAMCICCFYQQKRIRRRRREQNNSQRNTNMITPPILEPGKFFKLPSYDEVSTRPKDPPTYNVVYCTNLQETEIGCPLVDSTSVTVECGSSNTRQCQRSVDESGPPHNQIRYPSFYSEGACLLDNEVIDSHTDEPPPLYSGQLYSSNDSMPTTPPPYAEHAQQRYTFADPGVV